MSTRLMRKAWCLSRLDKAGAALSMAFVDKENMDLGHSLCECAPNILKGNVQLEKSQKNDFVIQLVNL